MNHHPLEKNHLKKHNVNPLQIKTPLKRIGAKKEISLAKESDDKDIIATLVLH